jgi:copper chaperone
MTTETYNVTGMTCGHCVASVESELRSVPGVTDVNVDLVAGGTSHVTVTSDQPLARGDVAAAVDEAGYALASSQVGVPPAHEAPSAPEGGGGSARGGLPLA